MKTNWHLTALRDRDVEFEFTFDRRDAFRLSLEMLQETLRCHLVAELRDDDLFWYQQEVERIFARFLPRASSRR
jgi:hypothetical protein